MVGGDGNVFPFMLVFPTVHCGSFVGLSLAYFLPHSTLMYPGRLHWSAIALCPMLGGLPYSPRRGVAQELFKVGILLEFGPQRR